MSCTCARPNDAQETPRQLLSVFRSCTVLVPTTPVTVEAKINITAIRNIVFRNLEQHQLIMHGTIKQGQTLTSGSGSTVEAARHACCRALPLRWLH